MSGRWPYSDPGYLRGGQDASSLKKSDKAGGPASRHAAAESRRLMVTVSTLAIVSGRETRWRSSGDPIPLDPWPSPHPWTATACSPGNRSRRARHPALSGSERDSCRRRDRLQRAVILQMRLKQAEPIKGELSGLFRAPRQLVHTRRVCQIACKVLRQIICKVTVGS